MHTRHVEQTPSRHRRLSWLSILSVTGYCLHALLIGMIRVYAEYCASIVRVAMDNGNRVGYESWEPGTYALGILGAIVIGYGVSGVLACLATLTYARETHQAISLGVFLRMFGCVLGIVSIVLLWAINLTWDALLKF